jgi:NTP pyrophosphatase (non-canonical NTP hydrolase)
MTLLDDLKRRYADFVEERNWGQFHTPKNLAEAISIEANELLELYLWHDNLPPEEVHDSDELIDQTEDELADIVIYCMGMSNQLDIDLDEAIQEKLEENEERFDRDTARKMTEDLQEWQRD